MIADKVLEGHIPEDLFVFDVHAHIDTSRGAIMPGSDACGLVDTLNKLGIQSACISSTLAMEMHPLLGNENVLKAASDFPGRLYGYAVPTPYYDYDISQYFYEGSGMIGIKVHGAEQSTTLNDPRYNAAYEFADKNGLPVLFHAWFDREVKEGFEVAKKYKNAKFIFGHSAFTDYSAKCVAIEACKTCDNVFVDTAISSTYDGAIEWIVSQVGVDKVLYGSDLAFFDCRQTFGKLALSKLSDSDKIKIFGENAKKIFTYETNF